jgi:hypothetical protein
LHAVISEGRAVHMQQPASRRAHSPALLRSLAGHRVQSLTPLCVV